MTGPGGGSKESYSTGRQNRSSSALTDTKRGEFTPTVRMPMSPAPTKGVQPLAGRVGAVHEGMKSPALEYARWGKAGSDPGGRTLSADLHMRATKNTGKAADAYSTPKPKTVK